MREIVQDAGLDIEVGPNQKGCGKVSCRQNGIIIVIDRPFMGQPGRSSATQRPPERLAIRPQD